MQTAEAMTSIIQALIMAFQAFGPPVIIDPNLSMEASMLPLDLTVCMCLLSIIHVFVSLTLKVPNKYCSRRHFNFYNFYFLKKISLVLHVNPLPSRGFT